MSKEIDKRFLIQTMSDVNSHNRREEIADCWRERDMIEKSKQCKDNNTDTNDKYINSKDNDDDERSKWAMKKLQARTDLHPNSNDKDNNDKNNNNDSDDENNDKKKKRKRKEEKKKHKKEKHKKEKQKKDKHKKDKQKKQSDSSDESNSDDSSSSDDENVMRSSITGKKIKLQREQSDVDVQMTMERIAKRQFLNSQC